MECLVQGDKLLCDVLLGVAEMPWNVLLGVAEMPWNVLSRVAEMPWNVLSRVAEMPWNVLSRAIHFCVMFCSGWQECHRIFFQDDKSFGCFVKGSKNDMFFSSSEYGKHSNLLTLMKITV